MDYLKLFQNKDLNLFSHDYSGIEFYCSDSFSAWYPGCVYESKNLSVSEHDTPETNKIIFASYGKVVNLTLKDWKLKVIVTPIGPLEIFSKYQEEDGTYIFPDDEIVSEKDIRPVIKECFDLLWEKSYDKIKFGDINVDFELSY